MARNGDGEQFLRQLEAMLADISQLPTSAPCSPEEMLDILEKSLRHRQHKHPLFQKLKQFTWEVATWVWDSRVFSQIRLVRELGSTIGWDSPSVLDAIGELDELIFARTYGRKAPPKIKSAIRRIAKMNLMGTYQLRNLLQNDRILLDEDNHVYAKDSKWLLPLAVVSYVVITAAMMPYLAMVLFAPIAVIPKIIGLSIYSSLYCSCCSLINRFLVTPHKLTPQIQAVLPKISLVS